NRPDAEAADTYREFCGRARSVTVRDTLSRENLEQVGITNVGVCPDVAWGSQLPSARRLDHYDIGISVRATSLLDLDATVETLVDFVLEGRSVLIIPFQSPAPLGTDDHRLHVELQERVRARVNERAPGLLPIVDIVAPDTDVEHRLMAIRACAAYITMRFHGLVAGLRYGIRTTSWCFPDDVKFKALAELLERPSLRIHRIQDARVALEPAPPSTGPLELKGKEALTSLRDQVLPAAHA
ncbi:MAG: polysaccharide pyruvyl transferase family protein, partial [Vicinamibacterales bacterium]